MTDRRALQPDTAAVLEQLAATPGPKLNEVPAHDSRLMFNEMVRLLERPAPSIERADLTTPADFGSVPVRLYTPSGATGPVIVFFHGGGFVFGDLESHDAFCAELATAAGYRLVAVHYRLAPEHPFPAAHDDCLAVTRWVASGPAELGGAVTAIGLAGDSAGGNLTAATAQALAGEIPLIKGQWLIYPVTDLVEQSESYHANGEGLLLEKDGMEYFRDSYAPNQADWPDPRLSPLRAGNLSGQPPAVVFTCEFDPLRDEGRAYAARLVEAGVDVSFHEAKGQIHGVATLRGAIASAQEPLMAAARDFARLL